MCKRGLRMRLRRGDEEKRHFRGIFFFYTVVGLLGVIPTKRGGNPITFSLCLSVARIDTPKLKPAELAFVSNGFVLARVRVRVPRHKHSEIAALAAYSPGDFPSAAPYAWRSQAPRERSSSEARDGNTRSPNKSRYREARSTYGVIRTDRD